MTARDVKVLRQADGHLLAGATDGVYRSADGGSNVAASRSGSARRASRAATLEPA